MTAVEQYRPQAAEVAVTDPTGGRLVAWAQAASAAHALATSLVKTSFAPKEFRGKPEEATAAILLGDELGLSPISALRSVFIIHGTPSIYAKTAVALVQSHGHEVWTESSTDREVVVSGRRKGSDRIETSKWDIGRAQKAKYTTNSLYSTNPQEMLWAKAAAEICKRIASDVLAGVPFAEDLQLAEPEPTATVSRRSAPVKRAPAPTPPEPEFDDELAAVRAYDPPPAEDDWKPVKATAERADEALRSEAQSKAIHAGLTALNIKDRDAGLAFISQIVGADVDSTKTLTKTQASRVIEYIKAEQEAVERGEAAPEPAEPTLDGLQ